MTVTVLTPDEWPLWAQVAVPLAVWYVFFGAVLRVVRATLSAENYAAWRRWLGSEIFVGSEIPVWVGSPLIIPLWFVLTATFLSLWLAVGVLSVGVVPFPTLRRVWRVISYVP